MTTLEEAALAMLKAKQEHQTAKLEETERRRAKDRALAQLHSTFIQARETFEQLLSSTLADQLDPASTQPTLSKFWRQVSRPGGGND